VGRLSKLTVSAVFCSKQGWLCPFILLGCVSLIRFNVCPLLGICSLEMSMFNFSYPYFSVEIVDYLWET